MAQNYPFGFLCPPGSYTITLAINDRDSTNDDWLIAPGSTPLNPLYHFYYSPRAKDGATKSPMKVLRMAGELSELSPFLRRAKQIWIFRG